MKRELVKQRPGDQPLPVVNALPRCHDMAAARFSVRRNPEGPSGDVVAGLNARLAVGLERYGAALQPFNGRDFTRDLVEELLDALAYGSGLSYELCASGRLDDIAELASHLSNLEDFTVFVCRLRAERNFLNTQCEGA